MVAEGEVRRLSGLTAVVTGASKGIGRETAIKLARVGARVVLIARSGDELARLAAGMPDSATVIPADLSKRDEAERAAELVLASGGAPDVLVNNAGAFFVAPAELLSVDSFEQSLAVNILAPFLLARAFLPGMRARGSGHIVTIGSIADRAVFAENAAYASSKFGLRALHEVLRLETRGTGIRATLVSPGPVDTRLWDPIDPDRREGFTPRESMLDPGSIADAVLYTLTRAEHVNIEELRLSRS